LRVLVTSDRSSPAIRRMPPIASCATRFAGFGLRGAVVVCAEQRVVGASAWAAAE
jgi:hypothetical protein